MTYRTDPRVDAYIEGLPDHVNMFGYDGGIVLDPEGIVTGGHENATARTIAVHQGDVINTPALLAFFQQNIAHNRAGGWRALRQRRRL